MRFWVLGRGDHIVSHPGYLHAPLQMFGPANGVCNYPVLEKIDGVLNLGDLHIFSPPE